MNSTSASPIDWDKMWQGYKDREADDRFIAFLSACFWIGLGMVVMLVVIIYMGWY